MKRISTVQLPMVRIVPADAVERLQRKFSTAKSTAERERFWAAVQMRKQPEISR